MRYPLHIEKIDDSYVATISHPNGRFQGATEGNTKVEVMNAARELIKAMIVESIHSGELVPIRVKEILA